VGDVGTAQLSIQERLYPQATCFGCGPNNPSGLQLKSFSRDDATVATFRPWPEHDNGMGLLNGGIIATILDCHSAAAVMHRAVEQGWLPPPGAAMPYLTAGLSVRFLRPAPLREAVELRATLTRVSEAEMTCALELRFDDKPRATAEAVWKRWRPR
jgi:acyl-coenzyme A thioesterase PaaI-like protein